MIPPERRNAHNTITANAIHIKRNLLYAPSRPTTHNLRITPHQEARSKSKISPTGHEPHHESCTRPTPHPPPQTPRSSTTRTRTRMDQEQERNRNRAPEEKHCKKETENPKRRVRPFERASLQRPSVHPSVHPKWI
ncbi:hypothetical protein K439DRAFT_239411 [Ramaria rubella]|nr:hypothetical protein K439DRAFT_239411 [Ramaria rubella]